VKAPNSGKGILSKTNLPFDEEFDEKVSILMTRRETKENQVLFYLNSLIFIIYPLFI
jgi:hypothetical protein